jgi:hypothetical protein
MISVKNKHGKIKFQWVDSEREFASEFNPPDIIAKLAKKVLERVSSHLRPGDREAFEEKLSIIADKLSKVSSKSSLKLKKSGFY